MMCTMPKPHPRESRDDVVAVARKGEAPISQVAKDFGISESCLRNWLHAADVADAAHSQRLADAGIITPSVGAVGSSYDDALAQSIIGL